ncbi:MAG: hypothetical protein MJ078_02910 [Clostridia bacterium]|nr:hypothetical protein [Clostridia bacterium]
MQNLPIPEKKVKTIAHRGLSQFETENTVAAFIAAGNHPGYYGIETDVHVTKDGKFILVHDDNLLRVSGIDMPVEESLYDDLKKVPLYGVTGEMENGKPVPDVTVTRSDLRCPDPEDYLAICKKYDKQAILEIKNAMTADKVRQIVELTENAGWFHRTTFISFEIQNLVNVKEYRPEADVQVLLKSREIFEEQLPLIKRYKMDLDVYFGALTKEDVDTAHALGMKVNVWTPYTAEQAAALQEMGVDFITSNNLE